MSTGGYVRIVQIAIAPESPSRGAELYGVGQDGGVYFFSQSKQAWIPLPCDVEPAPGDSGALTENSHE